MKKQTIKPVSVSQIVPVYYKGRIIGWNVHVFFDGDLSMNTSARESWRELIDKNPHLVHGNDKFLRPVLRPDIIIPNVKRWTSYFKYHAGRNVSEIEYAWCDDVFNCGARHAWDFRIKMLSQIQGRVK